MPLLQVEQGAKRARPSPDAHLQAGAAAAAPAPARPAAAAAGAGAAAGGAAGHLDELQESLPQCAICQVGGRLAVQGLAGVPHLWWLGLHQLSAPECCTVWMAAAADGILLCLASTSTGHAGGDALDGALVRCLGGFLGWDYAAVVPCSAMSDCSGFLWQLQQSCVRAQMH